MSLAPVVVLACGNPSRGDDALAPLLIERLQNWLDQEGLAEGCELITDFQWQVEHALDLVERRLALFIDAGQDTPAPFIFRQLWPLELATPSTHAWSPESVLAVLPRIGEPVSPPAFLLCVAGERFELGEGVSAVAIGHADRAFELLQDLCRAPALEAWSARVSGAGSARIPIIDHRRIEDRTMH